MIAQYVLYNSLVLMFYCLKIQHQQTKFSFLSSNVSFAAIYRHNLLCINTKDGWHFPAIYKEGTSRCTNIINQSNSMTSVDCRQTTSRQPSFRP